MKPVYTEKERKKLVDDLKVGLSAELSAIQKNIKSLDLDNLSDLKFLQLSIENALGSIASINFALIKDSENNIENSN